MSSTHRPVPPDGGGWRRVWYVLTTHFFKLVKVNLLFILFSLPVVTVPAAATGLTAVVHMLYREGNCFIWDTFFREFRTEFPRRMLWGLLLPLLPAAGWLAGGLASEKTAYLAAALLLILSLLIIGYWFPQMALLRLKSGQCFRNALILAFLEPKCSLILLLLEISFSGLTIAAWPFSAPFLVLLFPALAQLLAAPAVSAVINARLVHEDGASSGE